MNYIELAGLKLFSVENVIEKNDTTLSMIINASIDDVSNMVSPEYNGMLWRIRIVDEEDVVISKHYDYCEVGSVESISDTQTRLVLKKNLELTRELVLDLLVDMYTRMTNMNASVSDMDNTTAMTIMPIVQSIIKEV